MTIQRRACRALSDGCPPRPRAGLPSISTSDGGIARGESMDDLRFRLLGPMEILVEGRALALPGSAERALLAQLLLSPGRTIPVSMLIDRLWAESTLPVDPTNALQVRVSKLRRSLKANHT